MNTRDLPARACLTVLLGALCAGGWGCTRTTVAAPLKTNYAEADFDADLAYWHGLPGRGAVSNDEALHGLILIAEGSDATGSYESRVAYAKEHGWLAEGWDEPADLAAQRGTVSCALARILDVRGGVMMRVLGPTKRYAHREMIYEGVMPDSTDNQAITGAEFSAVITRAVDRLNLRRAAAAAEAAREEQDAPDSGDPGRGS